MKNKIEIFESSEFGNLRTLDNDGKIMFVASDVAKMLGYSNPRKAIIDHCKGVTKCDTPTNGGIQAINFIPEGDIYRLIAHSKLPAAERFESWVFDEVLPSIRKTGSYNLPQDYLSALKALVVSEEEKQKLLAENTSMKPKADFYDTVVSTESLLSMGDTAKLINKKGVGRNNLYKILKARKILMTDNIPYQQYIERGYFKVVESYYMAGDNKVIAKTTYVKQKGVDYIRKLLEENECA